MIPAAFEYVRADSKAEALAGLAEHGDEAKVLAGGHSLIQLMRFRLARPEVLIDVGRASDLSYIKDGGRLCCHRRNDAPQGCGDR